MNKAVILLGGPLKGTRFRPLSLNVPKPLFRIAGQALIFHTIKMLARLPNLKEILLIGFFEDTSDLAQYIREWQTLLNVNIKYLLEYKSLGTGGGFFHFKDEILADNPQYIFLINGDIIGDIPFTEMLNFHVTNCSADQFLILATKMSKTESNKYGCISCDEKFHKVLHFVEKPLEFQSELISCGVYLFTKEIFPILTTLCEHYYHFCGSESRKHCSAMKEFRSIECQLLPHLVQSGRLFLFISESEWMQVKSAGSAVYANEFLLRLYRRDEPELLSLKQVGTSSVTPDVYIDASAVIGDFCELGPNVTIEKGVRIEDGVRISNAILCENSYIMKNAFIQYSIIGWRSVVGAWARIQGVPCNSVHQPDLFDEEGRMNPGVSILANDVVVCDEVFLYNTIVLPSKEIQFNVKNQIIL